MPRKPLCRRGQIALPFLFVPLSLFLFVFLIFETAKLSREKIRHQFAVDAAAFIEMTNYSDFLNRSAYVNGAFPQRIFEEGFKNTMIERKDNSSPDSLYDILYKNGTFPRTEQPTPLDAYPIWELKFGGAGGGKNGSPPDMGMGCQGGGSYCMEILTLQDALDYWLSWDDAQDIYKLYVQIYQLLGSVEDAQYSVFDRLTKNHNFFRKSYWLNTGDRLDAGEEGARYFDRSFNPTPYCIEQIMFYGNKPTNDLFQPYKQVAPENPISMPNSMTATGHSCKPSGGLFQVEWISSGEMGSLNRPNESGGYPGWPIVQSWDAPSNFFSVDFNKLLRCPSGNADAPCVHATIGIMNAEGSGGGAGRLWPYPTPKFQTRLYP